jgi:hypothetical protein
VPSQGNRGNYGHWPDSPSDLREVTALATTRNLYRWTTNPRKTFVGRFFQKSGLSFVRSLLFSMRNRERKLAKKIKEFRRKFCKTSNVPDDLLLEQMVVGRINKAQDTGTGTSATRIRHRLW